MTCLSQLKKAERLSGIQTGGIEIRLYRDGELAYLQSPLLAASGLVDHAFSTRLGGCSSGVFASLNTAFHTGDLAENVLENRRRLFDLFNYDHQEIVASIQVHESGLTLFNQSHRGEGALPGSARQKGDVLVTTETGLPLAAYSADCMLIYFLSQQKPLAAIAHAGWRGTLDGIADKTVRYLRDLFGMAPERLLVCLSPAICKKCYCVDSGVADQFIATGWNKTAYLEAVSDHKWMLDIAAINIEQLIRAGIRRENLDHKPWCTACSPDLFYSYRRDQGNTGRMIGFIALKAGGR